MELYLCIILLSFLVYKASCSIRSIDLTDRASYLGTSYNRSSQRRGDGMPNPRKMQMAVLGVPKEIGGEPAGHCTRCGGNRAVAWVNELQGFRCARCLANVRSLGPGDTPSIDVTEEDETYQVSEAWQTIIENAGKMGPPSPPRSVEEE